LSNFSIDCHAAVEAEDTLSIASSLSRSGNYVSIACAQKLRQNLSVSVEIHHSYHITALLGYQRSGQRCTQVPIALQLGFKARVNREAAAFEKP
jgi:hypothetical protein